ncbi:MAG: ABC transporter ATP-binding protein [Acidobacteria bacterium]|nr:ABC transporter ATP-binding protein [Acidobacteriota bacterium]
MTQNRNHAGAGEKAGSPLIELEGLGKAYGQAVTALEDVSFTVGRGEWIAVMGPSGSGKTTLLNLIGCLDSPTAGRVVIEGEDVSHFSKRELANFRAEKVGFIFQQFHLIPYLTALENVLMAQYFHSMTDKQEALQVLDRVGLSHRARHLPSELSGGEQQRVAIARAMVIRPPLLLADEPTGELDSTNARSIFGLFVEMIHSQGISVVAATHYSTLLAMADQVKEMRDGGMMTRAHVSRRYR